jgi:hypothetical protein
MLNKKTKLNKKYKLIKQTLKNNNRKSKKPITKIKYIKLEVETKVKNFQLIANYCSNMRQEKYKKVKD